LQEQWQVDAWPLHRWRIDQNVGHAWQPNPKQDKTGRGTRPGHDRLPAESSSASILYQ
jgi:mannose/cellobiose epimerase-like protein (N-acyl-D-glucosamine 2-epimerase family)